MSDNKPLTQSEVDLLISQLSPKVATPPKSETGKAGVSVTSSQPVEHVTNTPSVVPPATPVVKTLPEKNVSPIAQSRPPDTSAVEVNSLQTSVNDLSRRLGQIEATVVRLENLEKTVNSNVNSNQVSSHQLQELMKRVQDLGNEVKNMSAKLQGTLGFDIYHSFTCDKCSSKGLVSTAFKCTKCGQISWRGWMPRK